MRAHSFVGIYRGGSVSRGEERSLLAREEPSKLLNVQWQWQCLSFSPHEGLSKPQLSFRLGRTFCSFPSSLCLSSRLSLPATSFLAEQSWQEGSSQVGNTEPEAWVRAGSSLASAAASPAPAAFPALLFVCLFLWMSILVTSAL